MSKKYFYAQIDDNNICVGVSELSGEVYSEKMITLDSYDASVMGKKYNNGLWEDIEDDPEPTQLDRIENRLNLSYTEAQNQAVDAYTKELIEGGII